MSDDYEKLRQDQLKLGIWAPSWVNNIDLLRPYIDGIKADLSDHCMKCMERMDACHEIEKKEITEHANNEIARISEEATSLNIYLNTSFSDLKQQLTEHAEEKRQYLKHLTASYAQHLDEVTEENILKMKNAIMEHADKEIDKIQKASEYIESNLETDAINNEDWNENPKFHCLLGSTFTESDIVDLVKFCLTRLQK